MRSVGIIRPPQHGATAAVHQQSLAVRVKENRGAVSLIAIEDKRSLAVGIGISVRQAGDAVDGGGDITRGEDGLEADQRNMRRDEENGGSEGDADRGLEVLPAHAQNPGEDRTDHESGGRQHRRQA